MGHRIGPDAPVLLALRHLEGIYPKPTDASMRPTIGSALDDGN